MDLVALKKENQWKVIAVKIVIAIWTIAIIPLLSWIHSMENWKTATEATRYTWQDAQKDKDIFITELNKKVDKSTYPAPEVLQAISNLYKTVDTLNVSVNLLREQVAALRAQKP